MGSLEKNVTVLRNVGCSKDQKEKEQDVFTLKETPNIVNPPPFDFQTFTMLVSLPQHCEFRMRGHYHCLRPGCYFVTNITTKLPWHVKKHEKAERRAANGFKYFTKREECGRLGKSTYDPVFDP